MGFFTTCQIKQGHLKVALVRSFFSVYPNRESARPTKCRTILLRKNFAQACIGEAMSGAHESFHAAVEGCRADLGDSEGVWGSSTATIRSIA